MTPEDKAQALDILTAARNFVTKGWTKNVYAQNEKGECVSMLDDSACSFCLLGALNKAGRVHNNSRAMFVSTILFQKSNNIEHIADFNDQEDMTQEKMLVAIDKTIKDNTNV